MNLEELFIRFLLLFVDVDAVSTFLRSPQHVAVALGALISVSAGSLGCYLLLREMSLTADAISHTVLLGIVLSFLILFALGLNPSVDSPVLVLGAAASGLVTVFLSEFLQSTRLIKKDSALAFVFTLFFAIGILLVSRYTDDIHLDEDSVMLGEIGLAWADTRVYTIGSEELRVFFPRSLGVMLLLCLVTVLFISVFFKELKVSVFDPSLARLQGLKPTLFFYCLMTLVSFVAVSAFNAVGSLLVVAFFIIPPSTAYLLSDRLGTMIALSIFCAVLSVVFGYHLASVEFTAFGRQVAWDTSISATMVVCQLAIFILVFCFSSKYGIIALLVLRTKQRRRFRELIVLLHIHHHSGTQAEHAELHSETMHEHINWDKQKLARLIEKLGNRNIVYTAERGILRLAAKGEEIIQEHYKNFRPTPR